MFEPKSIPALSSAGMARLDKKRALKIREVSAGQSQPCAYPRLILMPGFLHCPLKGTSKSVDRFNEKHEYIDQLLKDNSTLYALLGRPCTRGYEDSFTVGQSETPGSVFADVILISGAGLGTSPKNKNMSIL